MPQTAVAQDQSSPSPDGNSLGLCLVLSTVQEEREHETDTKTRQLALPLRWPRAPQSAGELHRAPESDFLFRSYFCSAFKAEQRIVSRQCSLLKQTKKHPASTCGAEALRKPRLAGETDLQTSHEQEDGLGA